MNRCCIHLISGIVQLCPAGADADRLGRVTLLGLRGGKVDVLVLGILDG
jgi:hypothetical protein